MNVSPICVLLKNYKIIMIDRVYNFARIRQITHPGTGWACAPIGTLKKYILTLWIIASSLIPVAYGLTWANRCLYQVRHLLSQFRCKARLKYTAYPG